MKKTKKLLQACPNCSYQFGENNYVASLAICPKCNSSSPKFISSETTIYKKRKSIVGVVLLLCGLNFAYLTYSHWDQLLKKESTSVHYLKRYWGDLKEDKVLRVLQKCIKKNNLQCQMLAYKKLHEIHPEDNFYKKSYEARVERLEKAKNTKPVSYTHLTLPTKA